MTKFHSIMVCVQIMAVYCQNRINKVCQQNVCNVTSCGTYSLQSPFNGEFVYLIKPCLFSVSGNKSREIASRIEICSLILHEERSYSGSKQHDIEDKEWRKIRNMQRYDQFYSSVFFLTRQPPAARASSFTRFLDHKLRHTTLGRTPPDG